MRDSAMFMDVAGIAVANDSLNHPPHPYFSVRIKSLSHLGIDSNKTLTGDGLTWNDLDDLAIPWGDNTAIRFVMPQPGWSYNWDINNRILTVTDDAGAATAYSDIQTISDLGISWDVLQSNQFIITINISGAYDKAVFLVASRPDNLRHSDALGYLWAEGDPYLNLLMHLSNKQFISWTSKDAPESSSGGATEISANLDGISHDDPILLLAETASLDGDGIFAFGLPGGDGLAGEREQITHNGVIAEAASQLMIYLFVSGLLNGSAPAYEPWMLFRMFQWLGQGSTVTTKNDRIFDLSPWWG